ncbi:MAG: hypothetical protein J5947_08885 [Clostridium sp.]|nr:hypothetical protein [Clostridium sp.]MBO6150962.1 hypothetical protein [Clostridium sp.]
MQMSFFEKGIKKNQAEAAPKTGTVRLLRLTEKQFTTPLKPMQQYDIAGADDV